MATIVYGVSGEGSGHSSRARVMAGHLCRAGHRVRLVSYDRGYRNLKGDFDVFETEGLHIASTDNKVKKLKTLTDNLQRLGPGHQRLKALRHELFKPETPDCVITDFEPMTAYLAHHYGIPLISIDNQHRLRYMRFDCPEALNGDRRLTKNIIRAMVPGPDVSLVTTFYFGPVTNGRTFLFPPILRPAVLDTAPCDGNHILVYLTGGFESFLELIAYCDQEQFVVYGYDRDETRGHVTFKPHSRDGFLKDLAGCKAVMATAGFTLITEALHLKKPYLAMPMKGQFEQEINARFLDKLGYGTRLERISREAVDTFLARLPEMKRALAAYPASDNTAILAQLDELVTDKAALARAFRRKRKQ